MPIYSSVTIHCTFLESFCQSAYKYDFFNSNKANKCEGIVNIVEIIMPNIMNMCRYLYQMIYEKGETAENSS